MVHVTTGNQLDVVYDYENGKQIIRGLKPWYKEELIPLPNPEGLMSVLSVLIKECKEYIPV